LKAALAAGSESDGWLISHHDLEFTKELGSGTSATVFKGLYRQNNEAIKVAIKVLRSQQKDTTLDDFKKEFQIMNAVRSPHIVEFLGACLEPRICIVLEYCSLGSLYDVLKKEGFDVGWDKAFKFSIEMSAAVNFLHTHNPPIFHRDMKTLNLLITESFDCKVCDFGLARFATKDTNDTLTKMCGTYAYVAPELFKGGTPYTDKCDVFSMGVILREIVFRTITGKHESPYAEYPQFKMDYQVFFQVSNNGLRCTIPKSCNPGMIDLIRRCWDANPKARPTTTEMLTELALMENDYRKHKEEWPVEHS